MFAAARVLPMVVLATTCPAQAHATTPTGGDRADGLAPLYRRIAADLQRGRPLVATIHVALCDNRVIWCGHRGRGDGDRPRRNLYWGAAAGLRAYFGHASGWRRIHLDGGDGEIILERVVYRLTVPRPSPAWRRLGVRRGFDVLLVGLAYRGTRIGTATDRFVSQVATEQGATLQLADGRRIAYGGQGHLVGYAGHNHLMDVASYRWPAIARHQPLGYFALACITASFIGDHLCGGRRGARALLLTRTLMYPGAFTIDGLLRGLAAGDPQHAVYLRGVEYYARYQKRPPHVIRRAFVHDGELRFVVRHPGCGPIGKHAR